FVAEVREVRGLAAEVAKEEALAEALRAEVVRRRDALATFKGRLEGEVRALRARGVHFRVSRARRWARRALERLVRSMRTEALRGEGPHRLRGRLPPPLDAEVELPFGMVREPPFGTV